MASQTKKFFKFVGKFLDEQGISFNEIVAAYGEEEGLNSIAQRDLVDRLREEGFADLIQPAREEGKVVETEAEKEARERDEQAEGTRVESNEQTRETTDRSVKPTPTTATLANNGAPDAGTDVGTAVTEEADKARAEGEGRADVGGEESSGASGGEATKDATQATANRAAETAERQQGAVEDTEEAQKTRE